MALKYNIPITSFVGDTDEQLEAGDAAAVAVVHKGAPAFKFDDTAEQAIVSCWLRMGAFDTSLTAKLLVYVASATANEVDFEVFVMAVTPGTDDIDMETLEGFDSANAGAQTVATTAGRPYELSIALTNADSIADGDWFKLGIRRDADDATSDDATGDAYIAGVALTDAA